MRNIIVDMGKSNMFAILWKYATVQASNKEQPMIVDNVQSNNIKTYPHTCFMHISQE